MPRFLVAAAALLVVSGVAHAAAGDPQKRLTPADGARARAMVLRASDLGPSASPSTPARQTPPCAAFDLSDLVVSGEARSIFTAESGAAYRLAGSLARVFSSRRASTVAWMRTTGRAGADCIRAASVAYAKERGVELLSFGRRPFPALAPATASYRAVVTVHGIPAVSDTILLRNGRAQVALVLAGVPAAYPKSEELRLATLTARRVAKAMRGAQ